MNEEDVGKNLKSSLFEITKEGNIQERPKSCPMCGAGTYLAQHDDRVSCGKCGYTKWLSEEEKNME